MTQPTIDQLRNLTNRAATGLTPDEQQRLRDGIDALHAERADAWQKFATVAAQRDRLRIRMNTLADRWEHALGVDKPYARTLRAEISIEPFGTDDTPSPAPATTPPNITHRWTWTEGGDRTTLPDWLTRHHHWHHDRPVIHTADGPRTLHDGWLAALWTDGVITVGSATVADRVYGDDGIAGRLAHAEAGHDRIRRLAVLIRCGAPWVANRDDLADRILAELDTPPADDAPPVHVGGRVNAEDCPACSVAVVPPPYPWICPGEEQPGPAATQATEAGTSPLRDLIAAAIYERNNPAHRWAHAHPDDLLAYGFDADAVLAVIEPSSTAHDAARGQVARVREAIAERRAEVADYEAEHEPSAWSDAVTVTCSRIEDALRVFPEPVGIRAEATHNDGPSVAECREADRTWPLQKTGE